MHATLRADAHVVAGPVWPLGPTSNAHLTRPEAAMPPVLAGRTLADRRSPGDGGAGQGPVPL